jgi:hypothetical protein
MFLVRIVFWSAIVLLAAPSLGVLSLPHDKGAGTDFVDTMRTDMIVSLQRVKAELADSPVLGGGLSRS